MSRRATAQRARGLWTGLLLAGALWIAGGVPTVAAVPDALRDRLQRAVELPRVELGAGFNFNTESLTADEDYPDAKAAAAKLLGSQKGTQGEAAAQLKLGRIANRLGDAEVSRAAFERAVVLYRQRLANQSGDAAAKIGLAESLTELSQLGEAEGLLRDVVRDTPQEANAWLALGRVLERKSTRQLAGTASADKVTPPKLSPEDLESSRRAWEEARRCFDQATASAPRDFRPFAERARHISSTAARTVLIATLTGSEPDSAEILFGVFTTNALPDLLTASSLAPRDYRLHAAVGFFTVMGHWGKAAAGRDAVETHWEDLPAEIRDRTRRQMLSLENLAEDGDPRVASGALENLALMKLVLMHENHAGTAALARRALRLDPSRTQAWEIVLATLTASERFSELQTVLEERIRTRPEPRTQFLLAKVLTRRERWEDAEQVLITALEASPNSVLLRLGRACLLVRRGDNEIVLEAARSEMEAVTKLLSNQRGTPDHTSLAMHTGITTAILFAMEGEEEEARKFLQNVRSVDPENEYLRKVLALLGN